MDFTSSPGMLHHHRLLSASAGFRPPAGPPAHMGCDVLLTHPSAVSHAHTHAPQHRTAHDCSTRTCMYVINRWQRKAGQGRALQDRPWSLLEDQGRSCNMYGGKRVVMSDDARRAWILDHHPRPTNQPMAHWPPTPTQPTGRRGTTDGRTSGRTDERTDGRTSISGWRQKRKARPMAMANWQWWRLESKEQRPRS